MTAQSVQGASHIKSNLPGQDAVEFSTPIPGLLLAAAADGAGSARESERGAALACRVALDILTQKLGVGDALPDLPAHGEAALKDAFLAAREAVLAEAKKLDLPQRELSSTLLLLAATPQAVCAMQIGDGAALLLRPTDEMEAITQPPEAEYLNETFFLVMDEALVLARFRLIEGEVKGVAMFTDGLQMLALKMPGAQPHLPFFTPLFRFIASESSTGERTAQFQKFLTSPRITQRADDDLTLLIGLLHTT